MAINVIVVAVTLMMGGFVVVWFACPRCRAWIEAPKWQPLAWDSPLRGDPAGHWPRGSSWEHAGPGRANPGRGARDRESGYPDAE